jgi:hypothetical protein
LVGVGVVELVEDGQGLLPSAAGGVGMVGGVVGIADTGEDLGFEVAVAELPVQSECLLAVGESLLVVAEESMAPTDPIEGLSLPSPVVGGPIKVEGLSDQIVGVDVQITGVSQVGNPAGRGSPQRSGPIPRCVLNPVEQRD